MKKYTEYKMSNIDWIDKLPIHWNISSLKYRTKFINGSPFKPSEWTESGVPIIRIENLNGGEEFNYSRNLLENKYCVKKGDLLFAWSGNIGTSFGPFLWAKEGSFYLNQHIFKMENYEYDKKYFYWLLKAVTSYVEYKTHGIIGLVHITKQELGNIKIPDLPYEEQKSIADFLDIKTSQIDSLILKKQKLIDLLKEERLAIINKAVTKGINPDAEMKDSGIDWLGKIPAHWEIKKLKFVGKSITGLTYSPSDVIDKGNGILVLRSSNLQNGKILLNDNVYVNTKIPNSLYTKENDILICSRNGSRKLIGKNAIIDKEASGLTFGAFTTVFRSSHNQFIFYVFNSSLFSYQAGLFLTSTINQLTLGALNNFEVPLPPVNEQMQIVNELQKKCQEIDLIKGKIQKEIDLLQEYRTALISEVVTGKIDVRDEVNAWT